MYHFKRSAKHQALHVAFVSIVFIVTCHFALGFLPNISDQELKIIYTVLGVVFLGLWVLFVIPNMLNKKGKLELTIDEEKLTLLRPDGSRESVLIKDIACLEKRIRTAMENYVEYWVISKNEGESFFIPAAFGLSPHKVLTELKKVKPELEVSKAVSY